MSGSGAAYCTNFIETIAVNKQTNPNLTVREILRHHQDKRPGNSIWHKIINPLIGLQLQGWRVRSLYYGVQATFFFLYLNHLTLYLDIDTESIESEIED